MLKLTYLIEQSTLQLCNTLNARLMVIICIMIHYYKKASFFWGNIYTYLLFMC